MSDLPPTPPSMPAPPTDSAAESGVDGAASPMLTPSEPKAAAPQPTPESSQTASAVEPGAAAPVDAAARAGTAPAVPTEPAGQTVDAPPSEPTPGDGDGEAKPAAIEPAAAPATDAPVSAEAASAPAPAAPEQSPAACAELLKQQFPALFVGQAKPLKLRIQADIQARAPGQFSKRAMGAFFHRYTGSTGYLIALTKSTQRFDLDGQPAGELSEEHRQLAQQELDRRRLLQRERGQPPRRDRPAPAAQGPRPESGEPGGAPRPEGQRPRRPRRDGPPQADGQAVPTTPQAAARDGEGRPARPLRPPRPEGAASTRGPRQDGAQLPGRGPRPEGRPRPPHDTNRPPRGAGPARAEHGERGPAPTRPAPAERPVEQQRPAAAPAEFPVQALSPEQAQAQADRRERAGLLREFERSPFTLANFCVLKGLDPKQVTPMIEQARKESPPPAPAAAVRQDTRPAGWPEHRGRPENRGRRG